MYIYIYIYIEREREREREREIGVKMFVCIYVQLFQNISLVYEFG